LRLRDPRLGGYGLDWELGLLPSKPLDKRRRKEAV
jgi:hypothetical protein